MSSSANSNSNHVNVCVEDKDAGYAYRFTFHDPQRRPLTVAQVQEMIVEASKDVSTSVPPSQNVTHVLRNTEVSNDAAAPGEAMTVDFIYEASVAPVANSADTSTTITPALLQPGTFTLADARHHTLQAGSVVPVEKMDSDGDGPLHVVRTHASTADGPLAAPAAAPPSPTSSSAIFFIQSDSDASSLVGSDADTLESVSFHEDVVSLAYQTLIPSANLSSSAASVQFHSEYEDIDFDSISFATVDTAATSSTRRAPHKSPTSQLRLPQQQQQHSQLVHRTAQQPTSHAGPPLPPSRNTYGDGEAEHKRMRGAAVLNPVAHMSVRERFEYYQKHGNRKKTTAAAAAAGGEGACVNAGKDTVEGEAQLPLSSPPPSTAPTAKKKKTKKSHPLNGETTSKHAGPVAGSTEAQLTQPQPSDTPASERELQLAALVQQLRGDVQLLLAQSNTDASRIAALRGALTDTQKEYRALHEAHSASLNQLHAYAAQMTSGVMVMPQTAQKEQAAVVAEAEAAAAAHSTNAEMEGSGTAAKAEVTVEGDSAEPAQAVQDDEEKEEVMTGDVDENQVADPPASLMDQIEEPAQECASCGAVEETGDAATLLKEDGGRTYTPQPSPAAAASTLVPVPALQHLSEEEIRALLKQMGYIYHNRLLRRENALLMHQLSVLKGQAKAGKKRKTASSSAGLPSRLRVVVRIRPVGLVTSDAGSRRESQPYAVPAALTWPSVHSLHSTGVMAGPASDKPMADSVRGSQPAALTSPVLSSHPNTARSSHLAASQQQEQQQQQQHNSPHGGVSAASPVSPRVSTDVFLQCDLAENRLQVRNPELPTAGVATGSASGRDGATLRNVRIIGPPLPQSITSVASTTRPALVDTVTSLSAKLDDADEEAKHSHTTTPAESPAAALRAASAVQQQSLYREVVAPLVDNALAGLSGTALVYGQVGSGKTYTMFGDLTPSSGDADGSPMEAAEMPAEAGVVPRALADLFQQLHDRAASEELLLCSLYASRHDAAFHAALGATSSVESEVPNAANLVALTRTPMWELQCSMVELYGDKVRDLLAPKIEVPLYDDFVTSSGGVKGSGGYRSSSAERRTQRQLREAQAAQLKGREGGKVGRAEAGAQNSARAAPDKDSEANGKAAKKGGDDATLPRKMLGRQFISPECVLHTNEDGGARVDGATLVTMHSFAESMQVLRRGLANREVHDTPSNAQSSRSHVIVTLTLKQQQWWSSAPAKEEKTKSKKEEDGASRESSPPPRAAAAATAASTTIVARAGSPSSKPTKTKKEKTRKSASPAAERQSPAATKTAKTKSRKSTSKKVANKEDGGEDEREGEEEASFATTAAEMAEQENTAQERYLQRRSVKSVTSRLVFVDLAGTDRGTGQLILTDTERARETQAIGKSLVALSDVMSVLYGSSSSGSNPHTHVPFRSHKLTMLLRDPLMKASECVVVGCVALSEGPMTALLREATPPCTLAGSLNTRSASPASCTAAAAAGVGEAQYWRQATDRLLAAQRNAGAKKAGDVVGRLTSPTLVAPGSPGGASLISRLPSTRGSVRRTSLHGSLVVPTAEAPPPLMVHKKTTATTAKGNESSSPSRRRSASFSLNSDDARLLGSPVVPPPLSTQQQQQQQIVDPTVDEELNAQLEVIAENGEAEEKAAAGALWITPRETLSTLLFLSRLWKA